MRPSTFPGFMGRLWSLPRTEWSCLDYILAGAKGSKALGSLGAGVWEEPEALQKARAIDSAQDCVEQKEGETREKAGSEPPELCEQMAGLPPLPQPFPQGI